MFNLKLRSHVNFHYFFIDAKFDFLQKQQVLLVTSRTNKNKWIVPGGGIDPGEDPKTAAVREVDEEVSYENVQKK